MNRSLPFAADAGRLPALALMLAALLVTACGGGGGSGHESPGGADGGDDSGQGTPAGPVVPTVVDSLGLVITAVAGGSHFGGGFTVGDRLKVTFRITDSGGGPLSLAALDGLRALVSGPTFNYQRVLAETPAPLTASEDNGDGSYTFVFTDKLPKTYLPPLNDTPAFGPEDGELTDQDLLAGTYTVGLSAHRVVELPGADGSVRERLDVGSDSFDFLLGDARGLTPRAVVGAENCDRCHGTLQAHDGLQNDLTQCLMCHTAGAEDGNAGGVTPGVSADFRVMIHKIHAGRSLPSVLGMTTREDGSRDYAAEPVPYVLADGSGELRDYSDVAFPLWPALDAPTLRDAGHGALPQEAQALEDAQRRGVVACDACHGDPDGPGPAPVPEQGELAYVQSNRKACGSCHDDVVWERPYTANDQTMPPITSDGGCLGCHAPEGDPLAVRDGHLHPLVDPALQPGLHVAVQAVAESGDHDGDGSVDPGEKVSVAFTLVDDEGAALDVGELDALAATISGPTTSLNLLHHAPVPLAALSGPGPYVLNLPGERLLEFPGRSTGATGDVFETTGSPHWDLPGAATVVHTVGATVGGDSNLSAPAAALQNFIDVDDPTGFARDDVIVVDPGQPEEEYLQVQLVDGQRLWFASAATTGVPPALRHDHPVGVQVTEVALGPRVAGVDYDLDAEQGRLTELVEFGAGVAVLVSYTTDFVVPAVHPAALNASPDFDETSGVWTGKSLVEGTYLLALWGSRLLTVDAYGESNTYRVPSVDEAIAFPVKTVTPLQPWALIDSPEACRACHGELRFHGGASGGFDTCLVCHGAAGGEDRPRYVSPGAPETSGVGIAFRRLLHAIHMGSSLDDPSDYRVVGAGEGRPPDDYQERTFATVRHPADPLGAADCLSCHGPQSTSWQEPTSREHPTEQALPGRPWTATCSACHQGEQTAIHFEVNVSAAGVEACAVCHDDGSSLSVAVEHELR